MGCKFFSIFSTWGWEWLCGFGIACERLKEVNGRSLSSHYGARTRMGFALRGTLV
jgi:hypothetical protein